MNDRASAAVAEPELNVQDPAAARQETRTILLLDGVKLFLRLEETLLSRRGWRLLAASSAGEARRILASEHVDLVLMDYVLPDATGEEMVRFIRGNESSKSAGILIVTARGVREHVDRCMAAGCDAFLFKPVSRAVLCARVQEMLDVPVRRHVRTLVRVQVDGSLGERFVFGNTVNLSVGGMLLESTVELAGGDAIDVRFFLPGDARPFSTRARVVRCLPSAAPGGPASYGLVFDDMPDTDRERVARFVALSAGEDAEPVA